MLTESEREKRMLDRDINVMSKQEGIQRMPEERNDRLWQTASAQFVKRKAEWAWFQTAECGRNKTIISVDCYEAKAIVWAMEEYLWKHSEYYPERDLGIRKCADIEWRKETENGEIR